MTPLDGLKEARRLVDLRERLERATGPDRELDLALAQALDPGVIHSRFYRDSNAVVPYTKRHYTASIDAALALVERVLPGWEWFAGYNADHCEHGCGYALLTSPNGDKVSKVGRTAPLAIIIATVSALIALAEADAGQEGGK